MPILLKILSLQLWAECVWLPSKASWAHFWMWSSTVDVNRPVLVSFIAHTHTRGVEVRIVSHLALPGILIPHLYNADCWACASAAMLVAYSRSVSGLPVVEVRAHYSVFLRASMASSVIVFMAHDVNCWHLTISSHLSRGIRIVMDRRTLYSSLIFWVTLCPVVCW